MVLHSFDYENAGYQAAHLIKMDILLNGRPVEELTTIVHRYCLFEIIFLDNLLHFFITAGSHGLIIITAVKERNGMVEFT